MRSPLFRGGMLVPDAATVQPARLARGLRRVLLERGVRIYEGTPVTRFGAGHAGDRRDAGRHRARRRRRDRARRVGHVVAAFRPKLTIRGSYMVVTEPAPERLAALDWTGGEAVRDLRSSIHYLRTTPDGRIAFGLGGLQRELARHDRPRFDYDGRSCARSPTISSGCSRPSPTCRSRRLGRPDQRLRLHVPFFGSRAPGNVHHGLGYTGNGVGPSHLGGKILAALALHADDVLTRLAGRHARAQALPARADPLAGDARRERGDLAHGRPRGRGRTVDPLTRFVAALPRRLGYNLGPREVTDFPGRRGRSWWLQEALAHPEFAGEPCPALDGDTTADVVILGGGYTGLWTAYFLKERDPGLDVVLLEQDICGGGPSGRNGGFVNGFWTTSRSSRSGSATRTARGRARRRRSIDGDRCLLRASTTSTPGTR